MRLAGHRVIGHRIGVDTERHGAANVLGTLVAVFLLATGIYGLQLVGAPSFISDLFNGLALIVAVSLSLHARRKT